MKTLSTIIASVLIPTAANAASPIVDSDGLFIWIFLGFFAVIIVSQLVPAFMLLTGLVKGILASSDKKKITEN